MSQQKQSGGGGGAMEFAVDASFVEIYEERCRDLFTASKTGGVQDKAAFLEVEESSDDGWHVAGLSFRSAPDASSLQTAYQNALANRSTGLSEFGHSKADRSACILTLRISQYIPAIRGGATAADRDKMTPAQHLVSTITIADNPGAEPLAMDPAVLRLREGARLNRAVTSLAGVIRALATNRRDFAGHGDSVLTKVLAEPLGGNCATTILGTLRLGEWERSAAVMDLIDHARRAPCFPVVADDAARGLQQRLRSRLLQINDARETYREQIQSTGADGIDPHNVGLQMAKLHELEERLIDERGDKAELLAEKEALLERLQRLNGMDKQFLAEKEELQAALIRSEEDRLEIARALVEVQLEGNEAALEAEKERHELIERVHELEARAIASEVRVKGAEQARGEIMQKAGSLNVDNERLKESLEQMRMELEAELSTLRSEHADVMGEVGGLKARNEDLERDAADLRKRLTTEVRRAEEAEEERDVLRVNAEKDSTMLHRKVEAAERAAEEAIATAEATKKRLVAAAEAERDEAVAAVKFGKDKAIAQAEEERDAEIAKAKKFRDDAVEEIRLEKEAMISAMKKEQAEAIADARKERDETTAYLESDRDTKVSKALAEKEREVSKALREKEAAVAAAEHRMQEAIDEANERVQKAMDSERDARSKIGDVKKALEASESNERRARGEADRALSEISILKERLETSRAQYTERLKEYILQVGDLERGAQVLGAGGGQTSDHVLRPSHLYEAAQALAVDLHKASSEQVADYRRHTEELQAKLTKAQRDSRALHAGYRALRHRFEDLSPVDVGEGVVEMQHVPHEDQLCMDGVPPTPAEAQDIDARGLAAKLADLREENARLNQAVRLAALDGRGPLAPSVKKAAHDTDAGNDILFFDADATKPDKTRGRVDSFNDRGGGNSADGRHHVPLDNENARLRAENHKLSQMLDGLKQKRPGTGEEELRRENAKLKVQLTTMGNMDKSRAQLAQEIGDLKDQLAQLEAAQARGGNNRTNWQEQRNAIKEFTDKVQADLERENRQLATRAAMAEEQIKEINAYMAQSTLAYQKEIMRLRSIIQATAPERLRTPLGGALKPGQHVGGGEGFGGGGGGGGGGGLGPKPPSQAPSQSTSRRSSPMTDANGRERSASRRDKFGL